MNTQKLTVCDFFCGAGGFSEGFYKYNEYNLIFSLDNWKPAIETHKLNIPECSTLLNRLQTKTPYEMSRDLVTKSAQLIKNIKELPIKKIFSSKEGLAELRTQIPAMIKKVTDSLKKVPDLLHSKQDSRINPMPIALVSVLAMAIGLVIHLKILMLLSGAGGVAGVAYVSSGSASKSPKALSLETLDNLQTTLSSALATETIQADKKEATSSSTPQLPARAPQ